MNVESICIFISGLYDVNCVCSDYVEMYIIILIYLFLYGLMKKLYCILFKKKLNWEYIVICYYLLLSIDRVCIDFIICDY